MFRIVGFGLSFCQNSAPLLLIELAYPTHVGFSENDCDLWIDFFLKKTQRGKFTAIFNSCWYLGSIISAWVIIASFWNILSLIVVSRSAMAPLYKQVTLCGRGDYPQLCRPLSQSFKSCHCGSYLSLLGGWFLQAGYENYPCMVLCTSTPSNNCLGKQSGGYSCQIPWQCQC